MRIVICALSRFSSPTGLCRYAANMASYLSDGGVEVFLFVGCWQVDYFRALLKRSCSARIIPVSLNNNSLSRNWWYLRELNSEAASLDADILHCAFPAPVRRTKFSGVIVTTIHDLYAYDAPQNFGFPWFFLNREVFKIALANSDGVVCVSQHTKERLKHYFPEEAVRMPISIIPNVVDFSEVASRAPDGVGSARILLCIAQHRKNKNLEILIKSFAALTQSDQYGSDLNLVIVGSEGPETGRLRNLASELAPHQIIFLAGVSDSTLAWLYQSCAVLVIPSSEEGFCLPLIEGMYFNAKIVCSDIPTLREIGSDRCHYFDLRDVPESLISALESAMRSRAPDHSATLSKYLPGTAMARQLEFYEAMKETAMSKKEKDKFASDNPYADDGKTYV